MSPDVQTLEHLILTRFYVRAFADRPLDESWLATRWPLFERLTLPSVRQQTSKRFKWLLLCDAETPAWARERLEELRREVSQVIPVTVSGEFGPVTSSMVVRETCRGTGAELLVTTRLDSDDIVAPEFVATIQASARRSNAPFFVNLPRGLETSVGGKLYRRLDFSNAFISLVERVSDDPATVFVRQHPEARLYAPVVQLWTEPLWMQAIHGRNVGNGVRGVRTRPTEREWITRVVGAGPGPAYSREVVTSRVRFVARAANLARLGRVTQQLLAGAPAVVDGEERGARGA